jgi:hypothetical protein
MRVALICIHPELVSEADSTLPPATIAEQFDNRTEMLQAEMNSRGWQPCLSIIHANSAQTVVAEALSEPCDCIIVETGNVTRPQNVELIEWIMTEVMHHSRGTPIAFNYRGRNSSEIASFIA